jgi:hypothetical protein
MSRKYINSKTSGLDGIKLEAVSRATSPAAILARWLLPLHWSLTSSSSFFSSSIPSSSSSGKRGGWVHPFHHRPSYAAPARAQSAVSSIGQKLLPDNNKATVALTPGVASGSNEDVQDRVNKSVFIMPQLTANKFYYHTTPLHRFRSLHRRPTLTTHSVSLPWVNWLKMFRTITINRIMSVCVIHFIKFFVCLSFRFVSSFVESTSTSIKWPIVQLCPFDTVGKRLEEYVTGSEL